MSQHRTSSSPFKLLPYLSFILSIQPLFPFKIPYFAFSASYLKYLLPHCLTSLFVVFYLFLFFIFIHFLFFDSLLPCISINNNIIYIFLNNIFSHLFNVCDASSHRLRSNTYTFLLLSLFPASASSSTAPKYNHHSFNVHSSSLPPLTYQIIVSQLDKKPL